MTMTVRLNPRAKRALDALARRHGQSRSDVVREALVHYAAEPGPAQAERPYDDWADVIGVVDVSKKAGGARKTTGERYTQLVRAKARARRAR